MKAIILAAGYFQKYLNTNFAFNFYLNFPEFGVVGMKNQIKNAKVELNISENHIPEKFLPDNVHQLILGSLLGDMHCKRECLNSNIEENHSIKQKDYLKWKYSILKNEFDIDLNIFNNPLCKSKEKIYIRKPEIRLRSKVSERLNIYQNLFYKKDKKYINLSVLNQLDIFGLAVWYCDDGYYDMYNCMAEIHTEGFSIKENQVIKKWFKERWGLNVVFKKDPSKNNVLLRFPVKDTDKFLKLISQSIFDMPRAVWYKLGHIWKGNLNKLNKAKLNKSRRTKVYQSKENVKIKRNQQAKEFYQRNRKKILKEKEEYRKTQKYKEYIKEYFQRPDVKKRISQNQKKYRQKPEYKKKALLYQREYRKRLKQRGGQN